MRCVTTCPFPREVHLEARAADSEDLFADAVEQRRATTLCAGCLVRTECLVEALDNRLEFGVWGGMTERERGALLRRRPGVASWRNVLEQARHACEQPRAS
ncbi:WhiB family transcriptional regulator [Streptomyces sp. NPDC059828]|uniref:WhiB family transcriptional regulator n=1 Tax=Streptomyces sp. NPDC059828 TaxID=3346965 RepID=UPI003647FDE1